MNKTIVQESLSKILVETSDFNEKLIETYFSKNYIQTVNNITLDYNNFLNHLKKLKSVVKKVSIEFNSIVQEGSIVFSNHTVTAKMQNDSLVKTKVIAEFKLSNGKIYYCDELTKLIDGEKKDEDLGSRI